MVQSDTTILADSSTAVPEPDPAAVDAPADTAVVAAKPYEFCLYISGMSPASQQALLNLRTLCDKLGQDRCLVHIIDVGKSPDLAEKARIFAIPTLVRRLPLPEGRVLGDLTETAKVMAVLGLQV